MNASELIRKVRRIQIHTSRVTSEALAGTYHSAFRGRGVEFEEVRPYVVGDDVRTIDWTVSARAGSPHVKMFREERELCVMLAVDLSGSLDFGTQSQFKREMVAEIMTEVGLDPATMTRYPHEFSGGQRQRIAIARAMILRPKLVVLDEPTSALDMTVQVQIVELLRDLQRKWGLAYIFISHDLRVVRALSHKVMVMKDGDIVEAGTGEALFAAPQSDYTRALFAAAFGETV